METDNNHILTEDTQGLGFFEIKIESDSSGEHFNLGQMSIETTKSLRIILDSLISIVEYENNRSSINLQIGLAEGSLCNRVKGDDYGLTIFHSQIEKAFDKHKDRDNEYVRNLKNIKDVIKDRQPTISFGKSTDSEAKNLNELFEKRLVTNVDRSKQRYFFIEFFDGTMDNIGGTKPNFHIKVSGQNSYPISISKTDSIAREYAVILKDWLYSNIKVSAFTQIKNNRPVYTLCDYYVNTSIDYYSDLKVFFNHFHSKDNEVDKIVFLTEKLVDVYKSGDLGHAKKLIRLFLDDSVFPSYLMTILRVSKAFRKNDSMSEILEETRIKLSNLMEDY